jgi:transcriptional regulator GlxA family with amidase domain
MSTPALPGVPGFHITLLAFDQMEALDFAGPFEVFTTATRVHGRMQAEAGQPAQPPLFTVTTVARSLAPVTARAGLRVLPDLDFATHLAQGPQPHLLVVPGGVVDDAMACPHTLHWVRQVHAAAPFTASVCTGAFILAAAGVLQGRVTTHWEDQADLHQRFPALEVVGNMQWVDQGRVITSAGISAGMGMSLHRVATLAQAAGLDGMALAQRTARQLEYGWHPQP